jgi:hypothetical protein
MNLEDRKRACRIDLVTLVTERAENELISWSVAASSFARNFLELGAPVWRNSDGGSDPPLLRILHRFPNFNVRFMTMYF